MRIKKTSATTPIQAQVVNTYSDSQINSYSCDYINGIVESGGTSDNYYVKYADGTLICYQKYSATVNINTAFGVIYRSTALSSVPNFAQTFLNTPVITVTSNYMCWKAESSTTNVGKLFVSAGTSQTSQTAEFDIMAIGKWK